MKYLLDTNICIYWFKGDKGIKDKLLLADFSDVFVSEITIAELFYGAYKSVRKEENIQRVRNFIDEVHTVWFDENSLEKFGEIKAMLASKGNLIDDFDTMIASEAICNDCVLVTNNVGHFSRIDCLVVENWKV